MTKSLRSGPKKPTINDIARLSGVSKKTVSRVLNNSPQVTEDTRKTVKAVIEKLNYVPDPQARGLASKRSFLIGLVYDNPNAFYISDVQKGILRTISDKGFELIMHPAEFSSPDLTDQVCRFVSRSRVDGIILLSPISQLDSLANRLETDMIPYVRISPKKIDSDERIVVSNDMHGAMLMTDHLASIGHRSIGFVAGPPENLSSKEKYMGFCEGMKKHRLTVQNTLVIEGDYTFESGIRAGRNLLDRKDRPSAIFAGNDIMANGVMRAASMLGLKIPEQVSVAGYDDNAIASFVWPDLTTIRQPVVQMGELAAEKLIAGLSNDAERAGELVDIAPELVVRNSTMKHSS